MRTVRRDGPLLLAALSLTLTAHCTSSSTEDTPPPPACVRRWVSESLPPSEGEYSYAPAGFVNGGVLFARGSERSTPWPGTGGSGGCSGATRRLDGRLTSIWSTRRTTTTITDSQPLYATETAIIGQTRELGDGGYCSGPGGGGPRSTSSPGGPFHLRLDFISPPANEWSFYPAILEGLDVGPGAHIARAASGEFIAATRTKDTTFVQAVQPKVESVSVTRELFRVESVAISLVLGDAFIYITKAGELRRRSFDGADAMFASGIQTSSLVESLDVILVSTTTEVRAFDKATGVPRFTIARPQIPGATKPALIAANRSHIYVLWGDVLTRATADGQNTMNSSVCEAFEPTAIFADDDCFVFLRSEDELLTSSTPLFAAEAL